jgi:hypothetical protein
MDEESGGGVGCVHLSYDSQAVVRMTGQENGKRPGVLARVAFGSVTVSGGPPIQKQGVLVSSLNFILAR